MAQKVIDLKGMKFGKLTVLNFEYTRNKKSHWNCLCECGNTTIVRSDTLKDGKTLSCGCFNVTSRLKPDSTRRGKLYRVYWGMKQRCHNPNQRAYKYYGARGIKVCDEWFHDYEAFRKWAIENGYCEGLTIDRMNNDGDYEPSNCRWVSFDVQANNKRQRKPASFYI